MKSRATIEVVLATVIAMCGCASMARGDVQFRNEGYALLYMLVGQEGDANKIFIVKRAHPPVVSEVKGIAQDFRNAKQRLDAFKNDDPKLDFKLSGLPDVEQKTRDAIEKTYTKRLLLAMGRRFEVEMLQSQIRTLDYGSHLAKVLAAQEDNQSRKDFLLQFMQRCEQHHKRVIDLLSNL